jgi:hypothetical protein
VGQSATVGDARCLSGPAGGATRASWSRGLLLGALVGLVARLVAGEANERGSWRQGFWRWLLAVGASSSLCLSSKGSVTRVLAISAAEVPIMVAEVRTETVPGWMGWCIP